jgi:hypothetical protein
MLFLADSTASAAFLGRLATAARWSIFFRLSPPLLACSTPRAAAAQPNSHHLPVLTHLTTLARIRSTLVDEAVARFTFQEGVPSANTPASSERLLLPQRSLAYKRSCQPVAALAAASSQQPGLCVIATMYVFLTTATQEI